MGFWEKLESENEEKKVTAVESPQEESIKVKSKFKLKKPSKNTTLGTVMTILIVGSLATAGYFYHQYRDMKLAQKAPAQEQSEVEQLTTKISQFMELPQGEAPVLATVSDKGKLGSQAFFVKAENGDKILIYNKAGQAILYRPSSGKIINVAQATLGNQNEQATQQAIVPQEEMASGQPAEQQVAGEEAVSDQQNRVVALYNGTNKKGITQAFEEFLTKTFSQTEVVAKETAARQDYEKTLIIDVSGKQSALAQEMATNLSAEVQTLPEGEAAPDADILIILGADRLK